MCGVTARQSFSSNIVEEMQNTIDKPLGAFSPSIQYPLTCKISRASWIQLAGYLLEAVNV
jgi:hypothetical protein